MQRFCLNIRCFEMFGNIPRLWHSYCDGASQILYLKYSQIISITYSHDVMRTKSEVIWRCANVGPSKRRALLNLNWSVAFCASEYSTFLEIDLCFRSHFVIALLFFVPSCKWMETLLGKTILVAAIKMIMQRRS